jgi:hypothetical protein
MWVTSHAKSETSSGVPGCFQTDTSRSAVQPAGTVNAKWVARKYMYVPARSS